MFTVRIWDWPTRIFHWSLALCIGALVITAEIGGNAMVWHFRLGYTVLGLLGFRVLWGVVGGHWSRWWRLPISMTSVRAYLRGQSPLAHTAGHNPLGSWSVLALVGLSGLQALTGLFADDEIANAGPLSPLVSGRWVSLLTAWHKDPGQALLLSLVGLHVAVVLWHRLRGDDLLTPMWRGDKALPQALPASRDRWPQWLLAAACVLLSVWAVSQLIALGGS